MIPTPFEYVRPKSLEEAIGHLQLMAGDAKLLAGGHSLIPAMKLRLAQPKTVIDLGGIDGLNQIRADGTAIAIGAMTTHFQIQVSQLLDQKCPLLPEVAAHIGDVQVRNRGTLGGSLAHADPAGDWPAAILALDAELHIATSMEARVVPATAFFVDMMQTAVQTTEILAEIRVPVTAPSVAYEKFAQKASGFAIAGVAVVLDKQAKKAAIGITGVASKAYRATAAEALLNGQTLTPALIREAAQRATQDVEPLQDIHASSDFRAHLARVNTQRALERAWAR